MTTPQKEGGAHGTADAAGPQILSWLAAWVGGSAEFCVGS